MSLTNGTINLYKSWPAHLVTDVDLGSDSFGVALFTSSYSPDAETDEFFADLSGEVSGSGYSQQILGSVSLSRVGGTVTFDASDPVFSAIGGAFSAKYWVIFDDFAPSRPLVCYGLLDESGADVLVTDGNSLTLKLSALGLFTLSES